MRALAAIALAVTLTACGSGAQDLLETAQLEEIQKNPAHARQLYEQIVRDHPDSPQAKTAAERLTALGSAAQ
ncbi:MAG TPA: tetratricopeptide repeat protein [Candidatus Eisenbacteria bacterium]|nr:tetratricopeptide repeat protein [Candidatus Eisenbacteria bacterium]